VSSTCRPIYEYFYAKSDKRIIDVAYETRLSLSTDRDRYMVGEDIEIDILLEYRDENGVWRPLAGKRVAVYAFNTSTEIYTDQSGKAKTRIKALATGIHTVKAVFEGD
jgi:hypothetical protein